MLYTIREYDPAAEEYVEHGVYSSFDDGMRFKYDAMDAVVPIDNEKARRFIYASLLENVEITYSEKGYDECDPYDELKPDLFDSEVKEYIEKKYPGWELLLDYKYERDNPYVC